MKTRSARVAAAQQTGLRVGVRQAVRQVLREHQVDAVVDGHHRPAGHQRRQHVVRRVEAASTFCVSSRAGMRDLLRRGSTGATARPRSGSSGRADRRSSRSCGRQSRTYSVSWSMRAR
ncbi:MAG: hypothetical protein MZV64_73015 [Ignavibacteriales bacterium]|nr:hypothetical protein [Ignavibacteriales bacterium]